MKYDIELYRIKAELCKTLSDPKRQMMISELRSGEKTVGDIAEAVGIAQPAASHHLAILRERGVVEARREGASVYYCLTDDMIGVACDLVHQVLLRQLQRNRKMADKITGS